MNQFDVVVIGGGAAGLMCAIVAGQRNRRVAVLEGSNKVGKKILMSGGGRCNFTNLYTEPTSFLGANPHFCKSALSRYTAADFIALVEAHNIPFHEKTLGQLFCDNSSKDILAMLQSECSKVGVTVLTDCKDIGISSKDGFTVSCSKGEFACDSLVVATGGLSIPKMGASDFGYRVARQFGLNLLESRAGLVPFTVTGALLDLCNRLAGVSCRAVVSTEIAQFTEDLLFTHRGLSGPAILQASSYWQPGEAITINLLPDVDFAKQLMSAKASRPKTLVRSQLSTHLPKALVVELQSLIWAPLADAPLAEISQDTLLSIGRQINGWSIRPAATEGYRTAEVTMGGVDTRELSSKTMECLNVAGLYFIGEVVDVTGHLGGFNFQWAWSSGHAAGQVA